MMAQASQNNRSHAGEPDPQKQGFVYDEPNSSMAEPEYVPEREFVLMPLFRRIGKMLGIVRDEQPEYSYVPDSATQVRAEPKQEIVIPELQSSGAEITAHATTSGDDAIEVSAVTEHAASLPQQSPATEMEAAGLEVQQSHAPADMELAYAPQASDSGPAEPVLQVPIEVAEQNSESETRKVAGLSTGSSPEIIPHTEPIEAARQSAPLSREEAQNLAAQVREAAARISSAVSQAAEWLHKEQQDLRPAEKTLHRETGLAEHGRIDATAWDLAAHDALMSSSLSREQDPAPAVQRELGWQQERSRGGRLEQNVASDTHQQSRPKLRVVRKTPVIPFWKRVNWAEQFAPRRVAILGACAMAILMVIGISVARRPAAESLPPQTRSLEPGGVTLTTHPTTNVAATPQQAHASRATAAKHTTRAHRTSRYEDEGPEVVTHYYTKQKPSPVHQTVAGGVRHYSDMQ